jgi:hypothetical protein
MYIFEPSISAVLNVGIPEMKNMRENVLLPDCINSSTSKKKFFTLPYDRL